MMKDMRYVFVALVGSLAIVAAGLSFASIYTVQTSRDSSPVSLATTTKTETIENSIDYPGVALGEEVQISGVTIRPTRIVYDDRCSESRECVSGGDVRVEFVFFAKEEMTAEVALASSTDVDGYRVILTEVYPKKEGMQIPVDQYRLVFTAELLEREPISGPSGVRGMVLAGPMCPVVREGVSCPDRPAGGVPIRLTKGDGVVVATTKTSSDGSFVLTLSPGVYSLSRDGDSPFPAFSPMVVSVTQGEWSEVLVRADTGIR